MSDFVVVAEYHSWDKVEIGLEVLEKSGFTADEVSLIRLGDRDAPGEHIEVPSGSKSLPTGSPTGLGMLLGGSLAAPLAMATLIGPIMVVGPLLGVAAGAGLAGFFEAVTPQSWEEKAADYEARVKAGSMLIVVNVDSRVRLDDAANPLKTTGPISLERFEPASG